MYRSGFGLCAVLVLTLAGIDGFQWTADLPDDTVKYACADDDLELPWDYTTSPGDDISSIQWFFHGLSQEMIAFYSHGNFAPLASFSNRVQHVPNAGIVLNHAVGADSGVYSVEISGHDASGSFFTYRRTVVVQVTDKDQLLTTDGRLHATLEPQAIYSNTTGEWSLVVSCGNFTYLGDPPFIMEWLTESGEMSPSGRYEDGWFQLEVLSGGDYTCRIPQHAHDDVCLVQTSHQATVHVDRMDARMTLMEARQAQLQKDNDVLKAKEANQSQYIHDLEQRLEAKDRLLDNKDANLTQSLQTTSSYMHSLEQRLNAKDTSLTQSLQSLSGKTSQQIGFTAKLGSDHTTSGTMVFNSVKSRYGTGYSSSSGVFTASTAGLYYFTTTAVAYTNDDYPYAYLKKDGSGILCWTTWKVAKGGSGSCGGVTHLGVGQRVYVVSDNDLDDYSTFSGVLINAD